MDQLVKPATIQQPVMSQTKTMILKSTGNEFHYVSPPQQHQSTGKEDIVLLAAVADAAEPVNSNNFIETTTTTDTRHYKNDTNNGRPMVLDSAGSFSMNLDSLPPPPPPPTVTITNPFKNSQPHEQAFAIIGRPSSSATTASVANVYGRLCYKDNILYITEHSIEIGRNSSTSTVHFHVGKNSFVSRKHLQLLHDRNTSEFYLICLSKNGVFVNDAFQRKSSEPLKLSKTYVFLI